MITYLLIPLLLVSINGVELDVNTFSNYLEVQNQHLHLEWFLDLENKNINGTAEFQFKFIKSGVNLISLDIYELDIHIAYFPNGKILSFYIDNPYPNSDQGSRLNINLDKEYAAGDQVTIRVRYSVDTRSRALSFMTKEQTSTKTLPYLFSQCEDANCRALAPLQDTPAIKQTYTATIMWEGEYDVFMSAVEQDVQKVGNMKIKKFTQNVPIPSYLIAIVAGNIVKKATGTLQNPRTFVISEPDHIDAYATELAEMEEFLLALEAYIGPYTWGTYTIVIQPPSFPIGGMENPLLTFANPTIMTGTGSGLSVTIHEMAHSWFGNTITCVNWSNMWINEGFTVFLERKGSFNHYQNLDMIKIDASSGRTDMIRDMKEYGMDSSFSSIHPDTTGINPDETFSTIPYEKGYQLLYYLEQQVGVTTFQEMLKAYLKKYQWTSIGEDEFRVFLTQYIVNAKIPDAQTIASKINNEWNSWVYQPGLPPVEIDFSTPLIDQAFALAADFITQNGQQPANWQEYNNYLSNQKRIFLEYFIENYEGLNANILNKIDEDYAITQETDEELRFRWFTACLLAKDQSRNQQIALFLGSIGRGKMIYPVYKSLNAINPQFAQQVFQDNIDFYHPISRKNIETILYGNSI